MSASDTPAARSVGHLVTACVGTSLLLDGTYPADLCREAVDRRRIDKLGEEVGEVIEAYGGYVGENPRKGRTHDLGDVLSELIDVAACALAAYEHLDKHRGRSFERLVEQTVRKHCRLADAIEASHAR